MTPKMKKPRRSGGGGGQKSDFLQFVFKYLLIFADVIFKGRAEIGATGDQLPAFGVMPHLNINMLSHRLFILCFLRFPVSSAYIIILTDVAHSWRDYCLH